MAELVDLIQQLQALPEDQHLFCPRTDADEYGLYYDEEIANLTPDDEAVSYPGRKNKVKEAQVRTWLTLDALQILAYDGDEAAPYKAWTLERLNRLMSTCDVCVRVYHQSKADWKNKLMEQYDEDMVLAFLREIDKLDLQRIQGGLDTAGSLLRAAEPKKRGIKILPKEGIYAFFEGLSCDALIRNEDFLQQHFDSPFQLIQTRKQLKLQMFLPSMTRFLFCRNTDRQDWAYMSWTIAKRNVLKSEFEWAVRDHLVEAMLRVQINNIDPHLITTFWSGVKLIIIRLDKDLISNSIRGLEGDFYRLILDHLHLPSVGLLDLIATIKLLLEKSPTDFWDAMDAITPSSATIVEQLFGSPTLVELLSAATDQNAELMANLKEAFSWIPPFRSSIKATNLAQVVRAFVNFLLGRFQSDRYTPTSRAFCFKEGLRMLGYAFQQMCERKASQFVGQPTVNGMLQILSAHIRPIVLYLRQSAESNDQDGLYLALSVIQHAFQLETQSLFVERNLISKKEPSPTETPPSSPIWKTVLEAIDKRNVELATHMLVAGKNLVGLEKHVWTPTKSGDIMPPTIRHFNNRYELLSQSITDVIDRIAEFDIRQLVALFEQPAAATAIVSSLFSSNEETRSSTVELLKVISSQDERRDALQHLLKTYYKDALQGISDSCRQIKLKKPLTPAPSMIRTLSDIIDVMCNSQDGILRTRSLDLKEAGVTMNLWKNLWDALGMIFETTEAWSNLKVYDKQQMMDLCRDTMQFAEQLFDQCSIFATALKASMSDTEDTTSILTELLELPATTMDNMAMWLRLRDEFLSTKSVTLISKLLIRLHGVDIEVDPDALSYIESILNKKIKTKLTPQQQAELQRALETHLGRSIVLKSDEPVKVPQQGSLSKYMSTGSMAADSKAKDVDETAKLMAGMSKHSSAFMKIQEQREANRARAAKAAKQADDQKIAQLSEFKKKRQAEKEAQLKARAAAVAKAKQSRMSAHTAEAGSGLEGLGVLGKDQAPKGEGLMHSSDESDEEGDFDEDLFGIKKSRAPTGPKTNIVNEIKIQQPVKKRRVVRSVKDMRARLAPDLSPLHKIILGWDYYHDGDFPPNSRRDMYSAVSNTFRTANDYQSTFEPLLTLEAWQGFVKAREENGNTRSYDIKIVTKASVDAFHELSSTMTHAENRELSVSEGDVVLLSKSKSTSAMDPHCLARIIRVKRKQAHIEVSYRVMPSNPLQSSLTIGATVYGMKIQSITPLEREYGAVLGLQYYDLCDEIIQAKPSPLLDYRDSQLQPLISTYDVNTAQSKAVKSAMDNDAFTLIQGPPGSGKTKTIVAIVGAILSDTFRNRGTAINVPGQARSDAAPKKLLVCAPSNAAVDELVLRFKKGIKTLNGEHRNVNIVRLGRGDAINAHVQDVTLEVLVNKKMGVNNGKENDSEATKKIFQQHKEVSEQLRQVRDQLDSGAVKGPDASKLQDDMNALRRAKALLGTKIDNAKDNERLASRNADLNRRRAQEQVLGEAHVICATLSGSGHDMFQGLSIEFETVIVDEAAQCVEMSALIPLKYGCSKCILVGDPKQLPPTVFSKEAARFQYEQSLFVRMQKNHPKDVHLLDTQYRMHPEISLFPSQTFYDGKLLDGGDMAGLRKQPWHESLLLGPYRFFDVQGQHSAAPKGHSLINIAEINIAMQLYKRLTLDYGGRDYDFRGKVGIITPYKSQLRELKNRFTQQYGPNITDEVEFNTTDAFQGRESEVIIFSCVRASPAGGIGFLQDIRRMNVGLTRAKSSLWVLGNSQSLVRGEFWRKLVEDAKRRDRYTDGNLENMLSKHSSAYPAPANRATHNMPSRPSQIKQEAESYPMSRTPSNQSSSSSLGKDSKQPVKQGLQQELKHELKYGIKQEQKDDFGLVQHSKRKLSLAGDEDLKMEDAEMLDVDSDTSNTIKDSGRNTPVGFDVADKSSTSASEIKSTLEGANIPKPGDVLGTMAMRPPKIRRRAREPVDPFIRRQPTKKPKTG